VTAPELIADLNRLLREGLAVIDETFELDVPRYAVTPAGRAYLAAEGITDRVDARSPSLGYVGGGDREKGVSG